MTSRNAPPARLAILVVALALALMALTAFPVDLAAQTDVSQPTDAPPPGDHPVAVYFFWGDGCPHCASAKPFLEELGRQYPSMELRAYEVWYVHAHQEYFMRMAAAYGFEASGVPTIFIGDRYWVGYGDTVRDEIAAVVQACAAEGCRDAGVGIIPGISPPTPTVTPTLTLAHTNTAMAASSPQLPAASATVVQPARSGAGQQLTLPLLGTFDLAQRSLAVSTALIAFVDGFNPCSLWVLSILLALTLHTGSRRKVLLVGAVFIAVTSLIYMLFITGLFTMFSVVSFAGWIRIAVALVALVFAAVNIKDYFWYKEGISFTIADEQKPGVYRRMRGVLDASNSIWGLIGATVVLSAGVSLLEFSCTAGFPVLWTNLLIAQQATAATFAVLLLLYMLIYQIDELSIFLAGVLTLKATRLEDRQGRILKLVGGMLMLTLAMVMLVNPAWMNTLATSLWVFAAAFGATAVVLLLHRSLLPRLGVYIGSELRPPRRRRTRRRQRI